MSGNITLSEEERKLLMIIIISFLMSESVTKEDAEVLKRITEQL